MWTSQFAKLDEAIIHPNGAITDRVSVSTDSEDAVLDLLFTINLLAFTMKEYGKLFSSNGTVNVAYRTKPSLDTSPKNLEPLPDICVFLNE